MSFGARFRGLRSIARSAYSEVYEATMLGTGGVERRVALKKLRPEANANEALRAAFLEEARLGAQLSCPHLVPVLELGLVDGTPFIISELIDGESSSTLLARAAERGARLPPELALYVGLEVCRAAAYLHHATDVRGRPLGLVHRDLSTNNVLLSWHGDVRVIDLGIAGSARRAQRGTTKEVIGTEGFMAPEQLRGEPPTQATDVYALACLVHALFTGKSPLAGEADRVLSGAEVKLAPEIDAALGEVLRRALAFESARRYADAEPLVGALWPLLRDRASADPAVALRSWLAAYKPEETITKVAGVAALFDLEQLGGIVSDDQELPRYTAVAPSPLVERPGSITRPSPPPVVRIAVPAPPPVWPRRVAFVILLLMLSATTAGAVRWALLQRPAPAPPLPEHDAPAEAAEVFAIPGDAPPAPPRAPEPPRPEPTPIRRAPKPAAAPPVASATRDDAKIRRALEVRGLDLADLEVNATTQGAWRAWTEGAPEAELALLAAIATMPIDASLVRTRFERTERQLAVLVAERDDAEDLERRFMDLRVVAARARTDKEREDVLKSLSKLTREWRP